MKRLIVLGLVGVLAACNSSKQAGKAQSDKPKDDAAQARAVRGGEPDKTAATEPSQSQRAVTDASVLKATQLAKAIGGPAVGKRDDKLAPAALFYGPLVTGVTVSRDGRMFVCFPRWGEAVNYTAAEVRDGKLVPYPDPTTNGYVPDPPRQNDPKAHLVSVQSVVADDADRVWLVDTGSINMGPIVDPKAPKIWAYDLKTNQRVKAITFENTAKPKTYLNDIRFDLKRGPEGTAYITDSGAGGLIVVDLASGESWRKLDGHPSTMADDKLTMTVEGKPLFRQPDPRAKAEKPQIHADGIALSPDGKTLYYSPLTARTIYAVSTDFLADRSAGGDANQAVRKFADKPSANDGLICDLQGRVYSTDFEDQSIRRFNPDNAGGKGEVVVQDERLLWPDTLAMHNDNLYITGSQLNRQAAFNAGQNLLQPPYAVFKLPIDGKR